MKLKLINVLIAAGLFLALGACGHDSNSQGAKNQKAQPKDSQDVVKDSTLDEVVQEVIDEVENPTEEPTVEETPEKEVLERVHICKEFDKETILNYIKTRINDKQWFLKFFENNKARADIAKLKLKDQLQAEAFERLVRKLKIKFISYCAVKYYESQPKSPKPTINGHPAMLIRVPVKDSGSCLEVSDYLKLMALAKRTLKSTDDDQYKLEYSFKAAVEICKKEQQKTLGSVKESEHKKS